MSTPQEHELLSQLAYQSWLDRGKPFGSPEVDWNRALELYTQDQSLASDRTVEQSRAVATPLNVDDLAPSPASTIKKRRRKTTASANSEVPMEVPPTTPTPPPTNPPTKAAGRTTRPKLNPTRHEGSGWSH